MPAVIPDNALREHGRIGWRNLVTASNIAASSSAAGFPPLNLANPVTFQLWKADAVDEVTLTVNFGGPVDVDYVGIARHNFGTAGVGYTIDGSDDGGATWDALSAPVNPVDDGVILHEFAPATLTNLRIVLAEGVAPPQAAVLYVGKITVLQRRIYVGHTPIPFGRQTTVSTGMSESGQFLGRVVRRKQYQSSIKQPNLDPDYYRLELSPFDDVSAVDPFFWAWRPYPYANEVAYCWTTADAEVSNQRANGMMEWGLNVQGIIR